MRIKWLSTLVIVLSNSFIMLTWGWQWSEWDVLERFDYFPSWFAVTNVKCIDVILDIWNSEIPETSEKLLPFFLVAAGFIGVSDSCEHLHPDVFQSSCQMMSWLCCWYCWGVLQHCNLDWRCRVFFTVWHILVTRYNVHTRDWTCRNWNCLMVNHQLHNFHFTMCSPVPKMRMS